MHRASLLLTLFATLAAAADTTACHNYVLISTRGTFEKQGPSVGFIGMINTTLTTLSGGVEYDTVYPATTNLTGVVVGVADVQSYINNGLTACPDQTYALLGYSQGASVTDLSLRNYTDTSSAAYKAIKAIVVIGNPGHVAGKLANVDENGGDSNRNLNGSYIAGGAGAIPDQYYADNKVLDICFQGDLVCALGANQTFAITTPHLLYGPTESVQKLGSDFMISKLKEGASGTASASASASATQPTASATKSSTGSPTASTPAATYTGAAEPTCRLSSYSLVAACVAFLSALL